jgi:SAM-dependent methyltransferase
VTRAPDFFSANAAAYDKSRPSRLSDSTREAILRAACLPPGGRILDVAAVLASAASLPFGNRTFDAVLIARLLYLTPDWQQILVEALRVLAAGRRLLHEWANGTPSEPAAQIKEHLRTLLEDAGVAEPFHPGARRESDVDAFLAERGCVLVDVVDVVDVPLAGAMPVRDFLDRIDAGEFSYTWTAPAPVKDRCVAALRSWASERFDLHAPAFGMTTTWKVFAAGR